MQFLGAEPPCLADVIRICQGDLLYKTWQMVDSYVGFLGQYTHDEQAEDRTRCCEIHSNHVAMLAEGTCLSRSIIHDAIHMWLSVGCACLILVPRYAIHAAIA